jgi:hypothetical protein
MKLIPMCVTVAFALAGGGRLSTGMAGEGAQARLPEVSFGKGVPGLPEKEGLEFKARPTVKADGDNVRIEFEVNKATDVAVEIRDMDGKVIRHLVAGVLGTNPPAPLKPGLAQSIEWDGKDDDGKPAAGAPFKVRVGLGLRAGWGGTAFSDQTGPNHLTSVHGLAVGAPSPAEAGSGARGAQGDGRVYVMDNRSGWLYWPAYAVHVFRRDGSYEKTIKPFPANTSPARIRPSRAFVNDRGYLNPVIFRTLGMTFYPYEDEPASQMACAGGRLYLTVVPATSPSTFYYRGNAPHLAAIDGDGGIPMPGYAGPALGPWRYVKPCLAASSDGKHLFVAGFGKEAGPWNRPADLSPFVCKVKLPECGPASVFFGDPKQPGNDNAHLNNPRGMASDGQGHLLVCDFGNNRVVVLVESDASFAGALPVEAPEWVGILPKTGAVYVHSSDSVIKFSGWKDGKEVSRLSLKRFSSVYCGWGNERLPFCFALDASADPPVLWAGRGGIVTPEPLLRCEDLGTAFSELEPAKCFPTPRQWRPASDPTHRLVSCRVDPIKVMDGSAVYVLEEATGETRRVRTEGPAVGNGQGVTTRLDRDGSLYCSQAEGGIWKCDPRGKRVPFAATADDPSLKGHLPAGSTGTTAWERDWYVDRKGDIYAKVRGTAYHGLMHVDVFGPDGAFKRTVLWGVTDGSYGPRVDPQGNLYLMEAVRPVGQPFPEELQPYATERYIRQWYDWIYGSIVKFSPQGGNLRLNGWSQKNHPKAEPVKLPDSMPRVKVSASLRGDDNEMQGALWMAPGVAHVGDMAPGGGGCHCHCTGCDFDVDDFGRAFAPDNGRQRVTVFDTNGNVILHFGAYGNQDCCGPDSYVLDPQTKALRRPRADDPKDIVSPFAKPEIAFGWIVGLAVTDGYAYVDDVINKRVLRVKLDYAASETTPVP